MDRAGPGKKTGSGWGMTLVGLAIAYVGRVGAFEVLRLDLFDASAAVAGSVGSSPRRCEPLLTARAPSSCCGAGLLG